MTTQVQGLFDLVFVLVKVAKIQKGKDIAMFGGKALMMPEKQVLLT